MWNRAGLAEIDTADDHYNVALAMDQRMEAPLHEATTSAEYAAHLRRVGASRAAIEAVAGPAVELARSRGWLRVLRLAGGPVGGSGTEGRSRTDGGSADVHPAREVSSSLVDPLTPRELEVLHLVAQGLRNRDIAAGLVISEYTAANHVRSILMKTGSANRTQAARFAAVHGLLDEAGGRPRAPAS